MFTKGHNQTLHATVAHHVVAPETCTFRSLVVKQFAPMSHRAVPIQYPEGRPTRTCEIVMIYNKTQSHDKYETK